MGWGGWARKLASAIYIINKRVSERAQRAPRGEASAPLRGAQPTIDYINLVMSYIPLENVWQTNHNLAVLSYNLGTVERP